MAWTEDPNDGSYSRELPTGGSLVVFIDDQDPADIGWAYRELAADGQEIASGPLEAAIDDAPAAMAEAEAEAIGASDASDENWPNRLP